MKKIYLSICIILFSIQISSAEYILSSTENQKVEQAIVLIQNFIDKNGEQTRTKLLTKIDQILARPNLSDKNIAIFTKLQKGLKKPVFLTSQRLNSDEKAKEDVISLNKVHTSDVRFIFENTPNRCSTNPCSTSENFVKIRGEVTNTLIKYIEVNDYRLKSYAGSTWEYNPNIAYGNFSDGKNTYTINYLGADGEILLSQEFIVNKFIPEIQDEVTDIPQEEAPQENLTPNPSPSEERRIINGTIPHANENEVREYWRSLLNAERTLLGLPGYTYDSSLDRTAKIWSDLAVQRGYIDHKVDSPGDSYYDYWKKAAWMEQHGVVCKNISRATFSESIAWNNYYCSDTSKCTQELKKAVKRTYDFYMSEKGKDYDPHYRAIAHPLFQTMGLGLSVVDQGSGKYKMYLTNHYCTYNTK